jgi:hypothetical protein
MCYSKRAITIFSDYQVAERALVRLLTAGFPMFDIAMMAKPEDASAEFHFHNSLYKSQDIDQILFLQEMNRSTVSLLFNLGLLKYSQNKRTILAGAVVKDIIAEFDDRTTPSRLGDCDVLASLGLSESQVPMYKEFLDQGNFLIFIDGYEEEISRAHAVLKTQKFELFESYSILPKVISSQKKNVDYIFSKNKLDTVA